MDNYENLGMIGQGTYGVVLKARHKETGQIVAIKKFKESDDDEQVRKTALREVRILKQLRHENIVTLIEVFRRKGKLYLVFEHVDRTLLEDIESHEHGLDPLEVKKIIWQLVRSIEFCHAHNVIHRDIKPENLLISKHGCVKLCDFGFARTLAGPGARYTDYVSTRWYRSPELLVGDANYGKPVDLWAMGCMMAEISNGLPLFPGNSDVDQLFHIMRTLGSLTPRMAELMRRNPLFGGTKQPDCKDLDSLEKKLPDLDTITLDVIRRCLAYEPLQRPTCTELLRHKYFEGFQEWFYPQLKEAIEADKSMFVMQKRNTKHSKRDKNHNNDALDTAHSKQRSNDMANESKFADDDIIAEAYEQDAQRDDELAREAERQAEKQREKEVEQRLRAKIARSQQTSLHPGSETFVKSHDHLPEPSTISTRRSERETWDRERAALRSELRLRPTGPNGLLADTVNVKASNKIKDKQWEHDRHRHLVEVAERQKQHKDQERSRSRTRTRGHDSDIRYDYTKPPALLAPPQRVSQVSSRDTIGHVSAGTAAEPNRRRKHKHKPDKYRGSQQSRRFSRQTHRHPVDAHDDDEDKYSSDPDHVQTHKKRGASQERLQGLSHYSLGPSTSKLSSDAHEIPSQLPVRRKGARRTRATGSNQPNGSTFHKSKQLYSDSLSSRGRGRIRNSDDNDSMLGTRGLAPESSAISGMSAASEASGVENDQFNGHERNNDQKQRVSGTLSQSSAIKPSQRSNSRHSLGTQKGNRSQAGYHRMMALPALAGDVDLAGQQNCDSDDASSILEGVFGGRSVGSIGPVHPLPSVYESDGDELENQIIEEPGQSGGFGSDGDPDENKNQLHADTTTSAAQALAKTFQHTSSHRTNTSKFGADEPSLTVGVKPLVGLSNTNNHRLSRAGTQSSLAQPLGETHSQISVQRSGRSSHGWRQPGRVAQPHALSSNSALNRSLLANPVGIQGRAALQSINSTNPLPMSNSRPPMGSLSVLSGHQIANGTGSTGLSRPGMTSTLRTQTSSRTVTASGSNSVQPTLRKGVTPHTPQTRGRHVLPSHLSLRGTSTGLAMGGSSSVRLL